MSKGTVKVGRAGRFGVRYGVKTRMQIAEIERKQKQSHPCPRCGHIRVKRKGTAIWVCRRCKLVFAGGAYMPKATPKMFVTAEKMAEADQATKEKTAQKKAGKADKRAGKTVKEAKAPKAEKAVDKEPAKAAKEEKAEAPAPKRKKLKEE
jgi:large subunit ribosomal protein L37Ae